MKLLSRKPLFIIGLALCFLVCAGIIVLRKKTAPAHPESKPYSHKHLQTSALEPLAKLHTDVEWAAEIAGLSEDIASFPDRFEALVGERGITLSGGQKQR